MSKRNYSLIYLSGFEQFTIKAKCHYKTNDWGLSKMQLITKLINMFLCSLKSSSQEEGKKTWPKSRIKIWQLWIRTILNYISSHFSQNSNGLCKKFKCMSKMVHSFLVNLLIWFCLLMTYYGYKYEYTHNTFLKSHV